MDGPIRTDRDLIRAVGACRDYDALAELVRRWDRPIYDFLAKASGNLESAKDLRQEVFLRVFRHASTYDPRYAFTTWLFRIAVNQLRTWQSHERRPDRATVPLDDVLDLPAMAEQYPPPDRLAMRVEMKERVRLTMNALEEHEREILLLRFQLDMNYREIGDVLGIPETTAKSRVYSLLLRLRDPLSDYRAAERTSL